MQIIRSDFCLYIWGFPSHSRISHSCGEITIGRKGLQFSIYARYSWALSSKGSLPCHTYCDRGIRLQWSSPRTRDTQTFCRVFGSGTVTTCFLDSGVSRLGFDHPTFRGERSHPLRHRRGHWIWFHKHILWRDMWPSLEQTWIFPYSQGCLKSA